MRLLVAIAFLAMLLLGNAFAAEICDGLDNDGDGLVDNGTCGNGQCDAGETFATCPQDCPQECITPTRMGEYIDQWKRGEISMLTLMQKIKQFKAGTGCLPA